jgi:hypothetical protein
MLSKVIFAVCLEVASLNFAAMLRLANAMNITGVSSKVNASSEASQASFAFEWFYVGLLVLPIPTLVDNCKIRMDHQTNVCLLRSVNTFSQVLQANSSCITIWVLLLMPLRQRTAAIAGKYLEEREHSLHSFESRTIIYSFEQMPRKWRREEKGTNRGGGWSANLQGNIGIESSNSSVHICNVYPAFLFLSRANIQT